MNKEENAAVMAMRAGFTLIEIIVAVAIIGILGTVATISITRALDNAKVTAAGEGVRAIHHSCMTYRDSKDGGKGKFPDSLNRLIEGDNPFLEGGEGALDDPWGNPYRMEKKGNSNIVIISDGPDGESGSGDDIRSDGKNSK